MQQYYGYGYDNDIDDDNDDDTPPRVLASATQPTPKPAPTSPTLKIRDRAPSDVYLQSLDISVEVTGNIATTRHTMVFKNRTGRNLEGDLTFPLPAGRRVTHYALDIKGKMREAVPVSKTRATQTIEELRLQDKMVVDSTLVERLEGNCFRTRIYPFPGYGVRTISIGYEEELTLEDERFLRYRLPLGYTEPIEEFKVTATVWNGDDRKPVVTESVLGGEFRFDKAGAHYVASFTRDNYQPPPVALTFALPVPIDTPQILVQPSIGGYYFLVSVAPTVATDTKKRWGDTIAIIWDVSLSASQRQIHREMEMLDMLFADKKDATVHLYFLNNRLKKVSGDGGLSIVDGEWGGLKAALESAIFDGGTDFSQINLSDIAGDEILFFSDGISTLSDANFLKSGDLKRPVHCVVSSPKADYGAMRRLAGRTGGKFVDINAKSSEKLRSELLNETLQFLGVEHGKSISEVYPSIATPLLGNFSVAGISSAGDAELTLLFGFGHTVEKKVGVKLSAADTVSQGLGSVYKVWAQKKIAELDLDYDRNREEIGELGTRFGIVTRGTSLIVLETLDDYVHYNIEPPPVYTAPAERAADTAAFAAAAAEHRAELWRAIAEEGEEAVWERTHKLMDALIREKKRRDKEEAERIRKHKEGLERTREHLDSLDIAKSRRYVERGMLYDAATSAATWIKEWWDTDARPVKVNRMVIAKKDSTKTRVGVEIYENEIRKADESSIGYARQLDTLAVTEVRKNHYKVEMVDKGWCNSKPCYYTVEGFVKKSDVTELSASEVAFAMAARSVSDYTDPTKILGDPDFLMCGCDRDWWRKPPATVADLSELVPRAANSAFPSYGHGEGATLNKLTGHTEADYLTYLKLREHNAANPHFYFDMAGWFYAHGDKETGLRVLTSIAELEQEDASLYRMLGYRFKEYGEFRLEKFVCKKVVDLRPMDPQSHRDYALALDDNGEEQAALDSLYALLKRPFSDSTRARYQGIAEVVVTEINRILAKSAHLNKSNIDERLIKSAPVDLRVVINWNVNNTDIDLHILDPNGNKDSYVNRKVKRPWLYGRMGLDSQDGYGPEQFMLKKAAKGKYQIYASYYGTHYFFVSDDHPVVTAMAEIYTKYGDVRAERRQVVCLHFGEVTRRDEEGKVLVAEFEL